MSPPVDSTHDPARISWVSSANGHPDFPVQNLPFGIFDDRKGGLRPGVAIGDCVLDLRAAADLLPERTRPALEHAHLNALLALPSADRLALRRRLSELLSDAAHRERVGRLIVDADCIAAHLPMHIGDYTDFYVGIHHATNVGKQFRPDNPLLPNYKWIPIGYHGRASSVRPSGRPVTRPSGQQKPLDVAVPVFGPSSRLDFELELGVWIGIGNVPGVPIPISEAGNHVAGLCLLNDWSARDFQAWEYQPLGPFLAKNFHTTISPWVVTSEALAPFRTLQPKRPEGDPEPLPYLLDRDDQRYGAFAIDLKVQLSSQRMRDEGIEPLVLSRNHSTDMYWTVSQIVTHHASNGCDLRTGDLLGTGTISAAERGGLGSLMEMTRGGTEPIRLPTGETRGFLADGDEIVMTAHARTPGRISIGFGSCSGVIGPART